MILAFDTYYFEDKAKTVCLVFNNWTDEKPINIYSEIIVGIQEYQPGLFFKRELPCILSLLNKIQAKINNVKTIVIDGFVILDDNKRLGLGGHLFNKLNAVIPVIGVAKSGFHQNKKNVKRTLKG